MSDTKKHNWRPAELLLEDVRERPDFQMRVGGVSQPHVRILERVLESGESLEPISVAKIGKAHYVVDGFHRLQASERAGRRTIRANVATMSLEEARTFALLANTKHGKSLKREDKARIFAQYVEREKHLDACGTVKSSRTIAAELNHVYSHETVRTKLRDHGVDLDEAVEFPGGYKPWRDPEADEAEEAFERLEEAREALDVFVSHYFTLEPHAQGGLLGAARDMVATLERGERPEPIRKDYQTLLDI